MTASVIKKNEIFKISMEMRSLSSIIVTIDSIFNPMYLQTTYSASSLEVWIICFLNRCDMPVVDINNTPTVAPRGRSRLSSSREGVRTIRSICGYSYSLSC